MAVDDAAVGSGGHGGGQGGGQIGTTVVAVGAGSGQTMALDDPAVGSGGHGGGQGGHVGTGTGDGAGSVAGGLATSGQGMTSPAVVVAAALAAAKSAMVNSNDPSATNIARIPRVMVIVFAISGLFRFFPGA